MDRWTELADEADRDDQAAADAAEGERLRVALASSCLPERVALPGERLPAVPEWAYPYYQDGAVWLDGIR